MKLKPLIIFLLAAFPLTATANTVDASVTPEDLTTVPFEQLMQTEVITASKLARQVSDAPSAVSIVTAEDIRTYGYRTLADVINSFPGLYTTSDRNYEYMGGRGFGKTNGDYAGRVMLLIDGYATQDNLFSQVFLGNDGILDIELIERVEYVPGTGAVSYGNNAMLGIINIVTKKGADFDGTQISTRLSSYGGQQQRITYGKQYENGADVLLSFSGMTSEGRKSMQFHEFDNVGNALGQNLSDARNRDGEQNSRFFAKLTQDNFMVELAHVDRQKNIPTGYYSSSAPGLRTQSSDKNTFVNAKYENDVGLNLKSATRFYAGSYENRDHIDYIKSSTLMLDDTIPSEQWINRKNQHTGNWVGIDQKFVSTQINDHTIVFGAEIRADLRQDYIRSYFYPNGNRVDATGKKYINRNERVINSIYIEDAINIAKDWQLVLGLRDDQTSDGFNSNNPRLSLIHELSNVTTLKASYSNGFKFPNGYDAYLSNRFGYKPASETVAATEFVVQHQLSTTSRISATAYQYALKNLTYNDPISGDTLTNGKSKTNGVEIQYESKTLQSGHQFIASASVQDATDIDGSKLANSPSSILKARYSYPIANHNLRMGIEGEYFGRRIDYVGKEMSDFSIANLTLSSEKKFYGLHFSVAIKNVFDKKYEVPVYLPFTTLDVNPGSGNVTYDINRPDRLRTDGRTFWLQASYDF
jgi:iron complex outermembrane receptor protein